jgi:hypothetical protein
MFLASARKGAQNGWHEIGPYFAEERGTIYNRRLANGRALTRDNEIVEKDRGSRWPDHRRNNHLRNGGILGGPQSREETGNEDYQISETLNVRLQILFSQRIMAVSI